jgi:hypothetical protein
MASGGERGRTTLEKEEWLKKSDYEARRIQKEEERLQRE